MMRCIQYLNDRAKRLNIFDVKLIQGCGIFFALIIVKIFPEIMELSIWWFVGLLVVFAIRPIYLFFVRAS
jgi:hypothetical protein